MMQKLAITVSCGKGRQSMVDKKAETPLKITYIHLSMEIFDYGEHKAAHKYGNMDGTNTSIIQIPYFANSHHNMVLWSVWTGQILNGGLHNICINIINIK